MGAPEQPAKTWPASRIRGRSCGDALALLRGPGNRNQALPDWRPQQPRFQRVDNRKDDPVVKPHLGSIKSALLQQAKVRPPRQITGSVEVMEALNLESGASQLVPQLGAPITAVMPKIRI